MNLPNPDGLKYRKKIGGSTHIENGQYVRYVDVYDVLLAFGVTCPARQHAIKKLLCAGARGKGNELDDLNGALECVCRAIELQKEQNGSAPVQGASANEGGAPS